MPTAALRSEGAPSWADRALQRIRARQESYPSQKIREAREAGPSDGTNAAVGATGQDLAPSAQMFAGPARVLIVDDSEEATDLLALLLRRRGHEVCVAHDVDGALRAAREFRPDVALLDIMIRHESGFFLAQELRELPELTSCRLIAMSGFDLERHRKVSEAVGFRRQLSKPIDPTRLYEAIEARDH